MVPRSTLTVCWTSSSVVMSTTIAILGWRYCCQRVVDCVKSSELGSRIEALEDRRGRNSDDTLKEFKDRSLGIKPQAGIKEVNEMAPPTHAVTLLMKDISAAWKSSCNEEKARRNYCNRFHEKKIPTKVSGVVSKSTWSL